MISVGSRRSRRPRGSRARRSILRAVPFLFALLIANPVEARPGGGESYSGGSSRSSGSSSSSRGSSGSSGGGSGGNEAGAELVFFLVRLIIAEPRVGVPIAIVAVGGYAVVVVFRKKMNGYSAGWSTQGDSEPFRQMAPAEPAPRASLERLRERDPDFSLVLFEDFLYAFYARVQDARGRGALQTLAGYVTPEARTFLGNMSPCNGVRNVVVGSMQYKSAQWVEGDSKVVVAISFEANYTEFAAGREQAYYVAETWSLRRNVAARSRPPNEARTFGCPNCGAPLEALAGSQCRYCGQAMDTGDFDWQLTHVHLEHKETRGPQLTGNTEEKGTDLPTKIRPGMMDLWNGLVARDPSMHWQVLQARIAAIFQNLQVGWSNRDWVRARPFVTDNLFQMQIYWMQEYARARLRNVTENARVLGMELANVTSDKYFDAITVRVFAVGLDYTISDDNGAIVSGSRSKERRYSEYWTLVRGTDRKGAPRTDPNCPNCGAPLKIAMTGNCEHCRAKVTSGEFDWVLSRIEQDESYQV